jgi:hypothetical protein
MKQNWHWNKGLRRWDENLTSIINDKRTFKKHLLQGNGENES